MNKTLSIESLKESKARYNIEHFRWSKSRNALMPLRYFRATGTTSDINPNGGLTMTNVNFPDGKHYTSIAECSKADAFQNTLGVKITLQRIAAQFDK